MSPYDTRDMTICATSRASLRLSCTGEKPVGTGHRGLALVLGWVEGWDVNAGQEKPSLNLTEKRLERETASGHAAWM